MIKYHGSVFPQDWDMSFEKVGARPTLVAFWENWLPRQGQIMTSMSPNEFGEVLHTNGYKIQLGILCPVKGNYNQMELIPIG